MQILLVLLLPGILLLGIIFRLAAGYGGNRRCGRRGRRRR